MERNEKRAKKDKELAKQHETKEEKHARRLAKKTKKEAIRKKHETLVATHGYSNEINPFNDTNLEQAFQWGKKDESDKAAGKADESAASFEEKKRAINAELHKVKRRREEREEEKRLWDDEKMRMMADADGLTLEEWEERGNTFELEQIIMRADNRLKELRMKPVDILVFTLRIVAGMESVEKLRGDVREVTRVVEGLSIADLRELSTDVQNLIQYDTRFSEHWQAILDVIRYELAEQLSGPATAGVHSTVQSDVTKQFARKTLAELLEAEKQIKTQLRNPGPGIDVEFWDSLAKQLNVWKSKAFLQDFFNSNADKLVEAKHSKQAARNTESGPSRSTTPPPQTGTASASAKRRLCTEWSDSEDEAEPCTGLSPPLVPLSELSEKEIEGLTGELDDFRDLIARRNAKIPQAGADASKQQQERLMQRQGEKLDENEEIFDDSVGTSTSYSWHDKYRARKPQYFNKVHTGFDWNRYNSTHYDVDNPPPKMVLGYKFNIFYPDLVNPHQQPAYYVEPTEKGWKDNTCILRFAAGAPYEDIAFKIVNKEWDKHWRAGFKCTFDRGVLALHFAFVRYRYRR